jgi:hypothetical protein
VLPLSLSLALFNRKPPRPLARASTYVGAFFSLFSSVTVLIRIDATGLKRKPDMQTAAQ